MLLPAIPLASVVVSSVSAVACCAVLINYSCMAERPKLTDPSSMIVFLTFSDLVLALIGCFLSRTGQGFTFCEIRTTFLIYFSFSSILWTSAMSHSSYVMVKSMLRSKRVSYLSLRYQLLCWVSPVVTTVIFHEYFGFGHVGGVDNRVCWFTTSGFWSKIAAVFGILAPPLVILLYNISILRYFDATINNFPASKDILIRLQRYAVSCLVYASKNLLLIDYLIFYTCSPF